MLVPQPIVDATIESLVGYLFDQVKETIPWRASDSARVAVGNQRASLARLLKRARAWAERVAVLETGRSKDLRTIFVDLDLRVGRVRAAEEFPERERRVSELIGMGSNIVLLGDPGAGKTTSSRRLILQLLDRIERGISKRPPILLELRDLGTDESLVPRLMAMLELSLSYVPDPKKKVTGEKTMRDDMIKVVQQTLDRLNAVVVLDGLDEVHPSIRDEVVADLRELILCAESAHYLVTCRTADFGYSIQRCDLFSLAPLTDDQIEDFADRWLGKARASGFIRRIRATPYSGSEVRPLTLCQLCALYERYGDIPEKPKHVYRKIVRLYLEDWDVQNSTRRVSDYTNFTSDRKEEFLEALAYELTCYDQRSVFSHVQLEGAYRRVCQAFQLPFEEAGKVVREIESHTGLIVEVSTDAYSFSHKSLQEYLTASYLVRVPPMRHRSWVTLPNEAAIVVSLSADPCAYLSVIVDAVTRAPRAQLLGFSAPFVRRLIAERVDFVPSEALGEMVIRLIAATLFPEGPFQPQAADPATSDAVLEIMAHKVVRKSVTTAIDAAQLSKTKNGDLIVWADRTTGRARLARHFALDVLGECVSTTAASVARELSDLA